MTASLDILRREVEALHRSHAELAAFCPWPDDVRPQPLKPFHIPAADLMTAETGFGATPYQRLCDALIDVSDQMQWRETYKGSNIDPDFMARFACYEIVGRDAPFASQAMRSFVVYQPTHLHYPWHHHPAEELYVVLAGEAEFHLEGTPSRTLKPGDSAFHPSATPHALTSHDHPVMAYVVWHDCFDTAPVWTHPENPT
ncbi:dimethylsulfoniopropionate lyase DddQ [Cognatiyoonia sediminum]|uniref:Dimethylsulfoniopropionate lyase DddQ n=1 Tax=Cognatiyoonia sediminum TaxID=1508389 RepID=A0A1M5SCM6_9RHOB|nr:dimethylsulfonioproprionate lyase family protein [Cognatiyoonia sediminum]SHH36284.1 dimethylsulfoniopropionate lyase DddQ [Cognatiyoonia sediminum]